MLRIDSTISQKHTAKDGHMGISIPGSAELSMSGMVRLER